ncbi:MAG: ADP-ribosylglycohydrolase family protein [Lachnospiraceae bacterium]|nr:ADP-ribosylglycohydrolase family protein [Lachnospiraceae bacterium]
MAIALYCALKYQDDFSAGMIAAVNHSGDSDSTGAVTGNILGALVGYERIEDKWKNNLELADIILEIADDLCHGCHINEYSHYEDSEWMCKYMDLHRYTKKK